MILLACGVAPGTRSTRKLYLRCGDLSAAIFADTLHEAVAAHIDGVKLFWDTRSSSTDSGIGSRTVSNSRRGGFISFVKRALSLCILVFPFRANRLSRVVFGSCDTNSLVRGSSWSRSFPLPGHRAIWGVFRVGQSQVDGCDVVRVASWATVRGAPSKPYTLPTAGRLDTGSPTRSANFLPSTTWVEPQSIEAWAGVALGLGDVAQEVWDREMEVNTRGSWWHVLHS